MDQFGDRSENFREASANSIGDSRSLQMALAGARTYSLDAIAIAAPVQLSPLMELAPTGANLAGVLDALRDRNPERFEELNEQLGNWIPEFNRVLFETAGVGHRSVFLRTREGSHAIQAANSPKAL